MAILDAEQISNSVTAGKEVARRVVCVARSLRRAAQPVGYIPGLRNRLPRRGSGGWAKLVTARPSATSGGSPILILRI